MIITPRTPERVHHEIAEMLKKGVDYIDALCFYAEKNNLEIEVVADIVKKSSILKEKVRNDAKRLNLMKKEENDDQDITKLCK